MAIQNSTSNDFAFAISVKLESRNGLALVLRLVGALSALTALGIKLLGLVHGGAF